MTTPISELDLSAIMPYGATYTPVAGSSTMTTTSTNSHMSGYSVNLDTGPVQVQTTWTGEEQCDLYLSRDDQLDRISTIYAKSGGGACPGYCAIRGTRRRSALPLYPRRVGRQRKANRHHHRHTHRNLARQVVV